MKIVISKEKLSMSPQLFLRKAGYVYLRDRKTGQDSYTRRLRGGFYPRFHVYIKEGLSTLQSDSPQHSSPRPELGTKAGQAGQASSLQKGGQAGQEKEKIIFNLHLDQKKPSYSGSHAHNAEYEGSVVEEEVERLTSLVM